MMKTPASSDSLQLEKFRSNKNEIIKDVEARLELSKLQWDSLLLRSKLMDDVLEVEYQRYKQMMKKDIKGFNMSEYKIDIWMRRHIVDRIIRNNEEMKVEQVMVKIKTFIEKFNLSSVMIHEDCEKIYGKRIESSSIEFIKKPLSNKSIDINTASLDNLIKMILIQAKYLDDFITKSEERKLKMNLNIKDKVYCMKCIISNVNVLYDISIYLYEKISGIINEDVKESIYNMIIQDNRSLGGVQINEFYESIEALYTGSLIKVLSSDEFKDKFREKVYTEMNVHLDEITVSIYEGFYKKSIEDDKHRKTRQYSNIRMKDNEMTDMKYDVSIYLAKSVSNDGIMIFRYFPHHPQIFLSPEIRRIIFELYILYSIEFNRYDHDDIVGISEAFEVRDIDAEYYLNNSSKINEGILCELREKILDIMRGMDVKFVVYLIYGMYMMFYMKTNIEKIRKCVTENSLIKISSLDYSYLLILHCICRDFSSDYCYLVLNQLHTSVHKIVLAHNKYITKKLNHINISKDMIEFHIPIDGMIESIKKYMSNTERFNNYLDTVNSTYTIKDIDTIYEKLFRYRSQSNTKSTLELPQESPKKTMNSIHGTYKSMNISFDPSKSTSTHMIVQIVYQNDPELGMPETSPYTHITTMRYTFAREIDPKVYEEGYNMSHNDTSVFDTFVNSVHVGCMYGILMEVYSIYDYMNVSTISYMYSSVSMYACMCHMYDMGCDRSMLCDVCLVASPVDVFEMYDNMHKMIGSRGCVRGKLYVLYSRKDRYILDVVCNSMVSIDPVGLVAWIWIKW